MWYVVFIRYDLTAGESRLTVDTHTLHFTSFPQFLHTLVNLNSDTLLKKIHPSWLSKSPWFTTFPTQLLNNLALVTLPV